MRQWFKTYRQKRLTSQRDKVLNQLKELDFNVRERGFCPTVANKTRRRLRAEAKRLEEQIEAAGA